MSALTCVNSKSLHGGYTSIGTYHSLTMPAVTSGNSLVMILALESGESLTTAPSAWNGTVDTPLVYLTSETVGSTTWRLYQLDNITTAPTSIRWKLNVENFTYVDVFEIGGTGGVAPTHKLSQKTTPTTSDGFSFSQGYTTTTPNEFVIAHLVHGSGGTQTPTAPFSLVTHGNYGLDSFYNLNAGAAGSKTVEWSSQYYAAPVTWLISFGNSAPDPTVSSVTSSGVTEGGNMVFTASLSGATSGSTNYAFSLGGTATAGIDYTSPLTSGMCNNDVTVSGGNFVVPTAVSSWTVTIPTTLDTTDEDSETIVLTVGGTASTGGSITDDDAPPTYTIGNAVESFGVCTFPITLAQPSGKAITFGFSTSNGSKVGGVDYMPQTSTVTIPIGAVSAAISILIGAYPAFTATLDNLVGLTGGGTSNVFMTGSSGGNGVIAAKVSASRLTGVAPLYVNFDATATTSTDSNNPSHELFFAHDFGDSGAGNWANGVQSAGLTSKNTAYGPVAGHVFETPGTYVYTCVTTDGVNTATRTKTITVQDPNVVYAGANTICLSTSGNFTGAPSGSQQFTVGSDIYAAFNTYKASNTRILFCKADAWTCTSNLDIANLTGLTLDGYGTGAARSVKFGTTSDTLVNVTPSTLSGSMFSVNASTSDIRIGHFKIAATGVMMAGSVNATINGLLFHKIEVRGCYNGYDAFNGVGVGVNRVMDQLCLYECLVDELHGTPFVDYTTGLELHGGCGAFVSLVRGGVMGCYIDTCNHGEQSLRIPYISRGHVSNNYIARPNQSKNVLKIHGFIYEQMPLYSEKWVVSGNVLDCRNGYSYGAPLGGTSIATGLTTVSEVGNCSIVVGPGGGINSGGFGDERVRNGIIENNYTYGCRGNPKSNLSFASVSCPNMTIRNNIADFAIGDGVSSVTGPYPYTYVHIVTTGPGTADPTIGVRVYNNTLYTNCASAEVLNAVYISEPTAGTVQIDQVSVKNNILYAPHHSMTFNRVSIYRVNGTGTNVVAANNTDEVSTINATPNFVATPPVALTDWRPNTGSYAINSGATVPVLRDFNNISRYGSTYDMGAVLP